MYFVVCVLLFFYNFHTVKTDKHSDYDANHITARSVADKFIAFISKSVKNETKRVRELRQKLTKIDSYAVDNEKYLQIILNETKRCQLKETNFYDSLLGKDGFYNQRNENKSLYIKLKEKMNRDDLLEILSNRGEKKIKKYARRMLDNNFLASESKEKALDEVVDKYLGEVFTDNHEFKDEDRHSQYWDPQEEIRERLSMKSGRRLFKGQRTSIIYYPFVVSIHVMGRFWCGGAIYWKDLIITSASCLQLMHNNRFFRENPQSVKVRVGSNHSRIGGEVVDATEVYFHPSYEPKSLKNNIALIRLRYRLKFSHHRVPKMIDISTQGLGMAFTAQVLLLGWGITKTSQKVAFEPIYLQSKVLPIYPNHFCEEVYGKRFITQTMFCAGTLTTGEGACDHDAGGPAVLNGQLVGIISFGPSVCGFPDAPTVFTLVGAYIDWIENVNETMPGNYRIHSRTTTLTPDPFVKYFQTVNKQSYKPISELNKQQQMEPPIMQQQQFLHPVSYYYPNPSSLFVPYPPSGPPSIPVSPAIPPGPPKTPALPPGPPKPPALPPGPPKPPALPPGPPEPPALPPLPPLPESMPQASPVYSFPPSPPPLQTNKIPKKSKPPEEPKLPSIVHNALIITTTPSQVTVKKSKPNYYYDLPPGAVERVRDFTIEPYPRLESGSEGVFND